MDHGAGRAGRLFRRGLSGYPPARVAPTWLKWTPHAQPSKAKSRPCPPENRQWLSQQMGTLEWKGLVYSNPQAVFAGVAMVIPRGDLFCLVVEYCAVNQQLEAVPWP